MNPIGIGVKVTHPIYGTGVVRRQFHDPKLPGLVLVEFPGCKPLGWMQPFVVACQQGELEAEKKGVPS